MGGDSWPPLVPLMREPKAAESKAQADTLQPSPFPTPEWGKCDSLLESPNFLNVNTVLEGKALTVARHPRPGAQPLP